MLKRISHALASAARELFRRWVALLVISVLYLAMLGAIYWFFATREATVAQLLLSLLLALAAPVLFLIIQTMAARYTRTERVWPLIAGSLRDFWKLLVVALPLIAVAALAIYLFSTPEPSAPAAAGRDAVRTVPAPPRTAAPKPKPTDWQTVAMTAIQYLLFCLLLPLTAIHLWIATARDGLKQAVKKSPRTLARAIAPHSVVIYVIGFIFFAVIPYFLIVTKTPVASPMLEATLLVARLALAVALSLIGWVVTVGALGELSGDYAAAGVSQPSEGTSHVPAEA